MNILEWETKEILITVKAYPNPSKKYQETTCVAGVSGGEWIRLYPINFRGLPPDKAFKKYELIKVKVKKRISDPRPESFIPDSDSIEKVGFIVGQGDRSLVPETRRDGSCVFIGNTQKRKISFYPRTGFF